VIYTNNSNTVDIFCSLQALPAYNHLLVAAVDIILAGNHNLHVLHVSRLDNQVADALSRSNFELALDLVPGLKIITFEPGHGVQIPKVTSPFNPLDECLVWKDYDGKPSSD